MAKDKSAASRLTGMGKGGLCLELGLSRQHDFPGKSCTVYPVGNVSAGSNYLGDLMQLATMPLDRVPVVSLDLETTGLRARADRIVQIGAIQSQDELAKFTALVHPGVTIPASSTRIHGITDEMVATSEALLHSFPTRRSSDLNRKSVV